MTDRDAREYVDIEHAPPATLYPKARFEEKPNGDVIITEERDDAELINGIWVPEGTLLLEPRNQYDKALIGVAHQGGTHYAVYSRKKALEITVELSIEDAQAAIRDGADPDPDADPETDALEHFDFNVTGSIGVGFPVFMLDEDE
jgi:hypothetical protein